MEQKQNKPSLKLLATVVIVFLYLAIGVLLVFSPIFDNSIVPMAIRIAMGVLFFVYGLFRAYRLWKTL